MSREVGEVDERGRGGSVDGGGVVKAYPNSVKRLMTRPHHLSWGK